MAELKTSEALAAAERAVNGQTVSTSSPNFEEDSSDDEDQVEASHTEGTHVNKELAETAGEIATGEGKLSLTGSRRRSKKRARIQEVG